MAPRKRRGGRPPTPQTSLGTQAVNAHGFPALPHEIYIEIISHIPASPIPTPTFDSTSSYPEIRRSRHETLLSLSQTSRSLRRFFWRYLWQRIEVQEGMKIRYENDTLDSEVTPYYLPSWNGWPDKQALKNYATELVRQLEIVTVRNPQLAQYVNYVDVFFGDYSIDTVLAEFACCLSLFPNLHTVRISVTTLSRRSLGKVFERVFKKHSYPQIRNVFVTDLTQSLIRSCPEARCVGFTPEWVLPRMLRTVIDNCPRLEVLHDFSGLLKADTCKLIVDSFPHLRTITISPSERVGQFSHQINTLKRLNHLQTIIILCKPWLLPLAERRAWINIKEEWIERVKHVLIEIQRRNNLQDQKVVIVRACQRERKILIPPIENL